MPNAGILDIIIEDEVSTLVVINMAIGSNQPQWSWKYKLLIFYIYIYILYIHHTLYKAMKQVFKICTGRWC